jgi:ribose-phosphate pyrophosphokinase
MRKAYLNLVYPEVSDIKYVPSKFPDGQQSIKITTSKSDVSLYSAITIYSRLNSFRDLEMIICATAALRNLKYENIFLYIPYFLGGRSDRKFEDGSINYIKDVIAPIINSQNYLGVIVLDPHSDVIEACINNLEKVDNYTLVKAALTSIDNTNEAKERVVIISPDAGAMKKIYGVAKHFGITNVVTASKVRDLSTGKILYTEVPEIKDSSSKKFVIIDDICDGGRTFIEIAKAIRASRPLVEYGDEIHLIVTHGIFSAGLFELSQHFTKIYSTNSVKETVDNVEYSTGVVDERFLTQFNVF